VGLQGFGGGARRILAPEQFDERVGRDNGAPVQPEHRQNGARFGARDSDGRSALSDLKRSQNPQLHGLKRSHVPDRACGDSTRGQDRVKPCCPRPDPAQARRPDSDYLQLWQPCKARISRDRKGVPVAANDDSATLKYPGGELDLDIVHASEGADGIALGSLLAKSGYTTFDNGFVNTASCKSSITYIDGDAGILRYRGIPIEQLAEKSLCHTDLSST
jgi:hypothetical protein